jgi:hypothetical protein
MTDAPEIPDENFSLTWEDDRRRPVPRTGSELEILTGFLDNHRTLFEQKCAGLSQMQMSTRAIPPSGLSLHGLLRHLSGVERWWFQIQFAGDDVPMLYYSDDDPDQDFESLDGDIDEAFAVWRRECDVLARSSRPPTRSTPSATPSVTTQASACGGCWST